MAVERVEISRSDVGELLAAMSEWEAPGGYAPGLHPGDIGWFLRHDDDIVKGAVHGWRDSTGSLVAGAIVDSSAVLRVALPSQRHGDPELSEALVDFASTFSEAAEVYAEAAYGSVFRAALLGAGWELDPDPWLALHCPLGRVDGAYDDPTTTTLGDKSDVADRVVVQRAAFEGSTFTVPAWQRMAAGPGFDPRLEVLTRNDAGEPVAAATAWSAGPGRCGILEPVGTHREHTGHGHGRRAVQAAVGRLARVDASGVTVHTPTSNVAATRLYQSCGLRPVAVVQSMRRLRATG